MRWVLKCFKKNNEWYDVVYLTQFKSKNQALELGKELLKKKEFQTIFLHDLSTEESKEL